LRRTSRPCQRSHTRFLFALTRRFTRFDTHDFGFDQKIVGAADHHEMFDIVAPHENQLPLPVEIKRIDDAQTRLTCPSTASHMQPAAKSQTEYEQDQHGGDQECDRCRRIHQRLVLEKLIEPQHGGLAHSNCTTLTLTRDLVRRANKVNQWLMLYRRDLRLIKTPPAAALPGR
jgi:hypothetical protein